MDAHDSKIIHHQGTYMWFAASYGNCIEVGCSGAVIGQSCGFRSDHNVSLWTSSDLVSWEYQGVVFSAAENLPNNSVLFAPKTVFNPKTREFVLWFNYIVNSFSNSYYGVATSKSAHGPFQLQVSQVNTTRYQDNGDQNLFVDDDGVGYLIYTSIGEDHGISIERLSDDFRSSLGYMNESYSSGIIANGVEAPMMFKRDELYYAVFGSCCCYCSSGSPVDVYMSTSSPLGPFKKISSLGQLRSQSTDIFEYGDQRDFMYVGDRWQSANDHLKSHDYTVWAPLVFHDGGKFVTTEGFQSNFSVHV